MVEVPVWCLCVAGALLVQLVVGLVIRLLPKDWYGDVNVFGLETPPALWWLGWWFVLPVLLLFGALWVLAWLLSAGAINPPWRDR